MGSVNRRTRTKFIIPDRTFILDEGNIPDAIAVWEVVRIFSPVVNGPNQRTRVTEEK